MNVYPRLTCLQGRQLPVQYSHHYIHCFLSCIFATCITPWQVVRHSGGGLRYHVLIPLSWAWNKHWAQFQHIFDGAIVETKIWTSVKILCSQYLNIFSISVQCAKYRDKLKCCWMLFHNIPNSDSCDSSTNTEIQKYRNTEIQEYIRRPTCQLFPTQVGHLSWSKCHRAPSGPQPCETCNVFSLYVNQL